MWAHFFECVCMLAIYIVLFFFYFSKTRRLENENRDCYFHTIYFCWKENLTFDTSIPDRMVSNWGDCILYNTFSSLKAEIWWKGTSHSNQVVVLGLVVVLHTDHHVCTTVQKLRNHFWIYNAPNCQPSWVHYPKEKFLLLHYFCLSKMNLAVH